MKATGKCLPHSSLDHRTFINLYNDRHIICRDQRYSKCVSLRNWDASNVEIEEALQYSRPSRQQGDKEMYLPRLNFSARVAAIAITGLLSISGWAHLW